MKKQNLQIELFHERKVKKTHGGKPSNEKCKRPFAPNKWLHISNHSKKASGVFSLIGFANKTEVKSIIEEAAKKFFIVIAEIEIMSDHYHLKARAKRKIDLQNFLRMIHSKTAKYILNAKKGQKKGKFWDGLVFSRLLTSAMEVLYLKGYFKANKIEREQGREAREVFLEHYKCWVKSLRVSTA